MKATSQSQPTTAAEVAAKKLYLALDRKRKLMNPRSFNLKAWARHLGNAIAQLQDGTRFERVLDWYCKHIGEPYIPRAYSAGSFREKFIQIEEAMERDVGYSEDKPLPSQTPNQDQHQQVTQSEDQTYVMSVLDQYIWPKGSARQLPTLVSRSLKAYDGFRQGLVRIYLGRDLPAGRVTEQMVRFAKYCHSVMHTPANFISIWFEDENERGHTLKKWDGALRMFSVENKTFRNDGYDLANDCGVPLEVWDQMIALIQEFTNEG